MYDISQPYIASAKAPAIAAVRCLSPGHSSFSSNSYNRGYEDGYDDYCMDHNVFGCQDEYGYHDDCDYGYDDNSYDDCHNDDFYDF